MQFLSTGKAKWGRAQSDADNSEKLLGDDTAVCGTRCIKSKEKGICRIWVVYANYRPEKSGDLWCAKCVVDMKFGKYVNWRDSGLVTSFGQIDLRIHMKKKKNILKKSKNFRSLRFYIFLLAQKVQKWWKNFGKNLWMCNGWKSISQIQRFKEGLRYGILWLVETI